MHHLQQIKPTKKKNALTHYLKINVSRFVILHEPQTQHKQIKNENKLTSINDLVKVLQFLFQEILCKIFRIALLWNLPYRILNEVVRNKQ